MTNTLDLGRARCGNCRFGRNYAAPKGERPVVPPEPKRKWWEDLFCPMIISPSARSMVLMSQANWDAAKRRAQNNVRCQRFPEAEKKRKADWCGEFRAKAKRRAA